MLLVSYSAQATGAAYQAASQAGYAVAAPATAAAAATYGTQRPAGYDTAAYQAAAAAAAPGATYAAVSTGATPAYEYGYGKIRYNNTIWKLSTSKFNRTRNND